MFAIAAAIAINLNVGAAVHDSYFNIDGIDQYRAMNPLGVLELEVKQRDVSFMFRHQSSIEHTNDGTGINTIELKYQFELFRR